MITTTKGYRHRVQANHRGRSLKSPDGSSDLQGQCRVGPLLRAPDTVPGQGQTPVHAVCVRLLQCLPGARRRCQATEPDSQVGSEFFTRVSEARWHDCTWSKLEEEIQTWFGHGKVKQDDYVFCDLALGERVSNVSVAEDAVTELHLSDHAPLVVDFDQM